MSNKVCGSIGKDDTFTLDNGIVTLIHKAIRKNNEVEITSKLFAETKAGISAFCKRFGLTSTKENHDKAIEVITFYNRQVKTDDKNGTVVSDKFDGLDDAERLEAIEMERKLKHFKAKSKAAR